MNGCVRSASSTTSGSRADTSYGQRSRNAGVSANARLRSDSWRWHSASSESLRPAQIGSPIPRIGLPARAVLVDELVPGRDDARRVRSHLGHVGEEHAVGVLAERFAKPRDLLGVQDDEDGLAGLDAVTDELEHPTQKLVRAPVEEGLVDEGWILVADRNSHSAQSYASRVPRLSELKLCPDVRASRKPWFSSLRHWRPFFWETHVKPSRLQEVPYWRTGADWT